MAGGARPEWTMANAMPAPEYHKLLFLVLCSATDETGPGASLALRCAALPQRQGPNDNTTGSHLQLCAQSMFIGATRFVVRVWLVCEDHQRGSWGNMENGEKTAWTARRQTAQQVKWVRMSCRPMYKT